METSTRRRLTSKMGLHPIDLFRLTAAGVPDATSGTAGVITVPTNPLLPNGVGPQYAAAFTLIPQTNGQLILAGDQPGGP